MMMIMVISDVVFQVSSVFVDKARFGTVYPKEVPYLQRIQPKDPISLENLGYVRQLHLISAHILAGIQCQSIKYIPVNLSPPGTKVYVNRDSSKIPRNAKRTK